MPREHDVEERDRRDKNRKKTPQGASGKRPQGQRRSRVPEGNRGSHDLLPRQLELKWQRLVRLAFGKRHAHMLPPLQRFVT
jgi:hypothetical protein